MKPTLLLLALLLLASCSRVDDDVERYEIQVSEDGQNIVAERAGE